MEILRTANAGVLLKLDGVTILLDGVCREVKPYLATPSRQRENLESNWPDAVAFTHAHKDHYDPGFAAAYTRQTGGVIFGPVGLPGVQTTQDPGKVGDVTVIPVKSRHIGAAGKITPHYSFVLSGSRCVWFLGDASPLQWKGRDDLPKPDVLIVPYAYAVTPAGWQAAMAMGAKHIVLVHMPLKTADPDGLWDAVEAVTKATAKGILWIPALEEYIEI